MLPTPAQVQDQSISQTSSNPFTRQRAAAPSGRREPVWDYPLRKPTLSCLAVRYGLARKRVQGRCFVLTCRMNEDLLSKLLYRTGVYYNFSYFAVKQTVTNQKCFRLPDLPYSVIIVPKFYIISCIRLDQTPNKQSCYFIDCEPFFFIYNVLNAPWLKSYNFS